MTTSTCFSLVMTIYPAGFSKNDKRALRRKASDNRYIKLRAVHYSIVRGNLTTGSKSHGMHMSGREYSRRATPFLKVCLDKVLCLVCKRVHHYEGGHLGRDKTFEKISAKFYWKSQWKDVVDFVSKVAQARQKRDYDRKRHNKKVIKLLD